MQEIKSSKENKYALSVLSIVILVVFLVIVGGLYWWVSNKGKGQIVFPAGINYTGNESTPPPQPQRPTYDYSTLATASNWVDFTSPRGQYVFKYPPEMIPLIFPGDVNDSVTFDVADVPAQFNLMVLAEIISNYDAKLRGRQEDFVRNYWKFFGGLKELESIETYQTDEGLRGWKAKYITQSDVVGSDNYFFLIPDQPDKIIHVNNIFPTDGQAVFMRLLNSLENKK